MTAAAIVFEDVSKFYGEVLGVNRVTLSIPPGITSLVGPNGSGKSTLMNLATGLLRPTRGSVNVRGVTVDHPEELFRLVGYCTSFDSFAKGLTAMELLDGALRLHGHGARRARELAEQALAKVGLARDAWTRKIAAYSKGMRQRTRLAHALAHDPPVLLLDEPLNGLDPMARAETLAMFREWGEAGRHVLLSSHILHEVEQVSDQVILLKGGYVVAEGSIHGVRTEVEAKPLQILVRCDRPSLVGARALETAGALEVTLDEDGRGLVLRTKDVDAFHRLLGRLVVDDGLAVERVAVADDDVQAVYRYLIEGEGEAR